MSELLWQFERVTLKGNRRPRLENVSVEIRHGVTAVVGYSGAGKTSLLNLLAKFEVPHAGRMRVSVPSHADRLPLYWLPQTGGLWPHLTVAEHLEAVMPPSRDQARQADQLLCEFDLDGKAAEYPDRLSEGECARLALSRTLASRAEVLVLDEPLVHVDPARIGKYWRALRKHRAETGAAIVIATHSPETVLREADQAICLKQGRVLYAGEVGELYFRPQTLELAEFLGPANWLTPDESEHWLSASPSVSSSSLATRATDCCHRPEQITIDRNDDGPFVVQSSQFAGSIAEVELRDAKTGRTHTFFHRPAGNTLQRGDRVFASRRRFVVD